MNEKIKELLYRSMDEQLPEDEALLLEQALRQSESLREEQALALKFRAALNSDEDEGFAPGFAQRVMLRLGGQEMREHVNGVFTGALVRLFRPVAAAAVAAAVVLAGWNVAVTGEVAPTVEDDAYAETDTGVLRTPLDALFEEAS